MAAPGDDEIRVTVVDPGEKLRCEVSWEGTELVVESVKPGGAAHRCGVMAGDVIAAINGRPTRGRSEKELRREMKDRPLEMSLRRPRAAVGAAEELSAQQPSDSGSEFCSDCDLTLPAGPDGRLEADMAILQAARQSLRGHAPHSSGTRPPPRMFAAAAAPAGAAAASSSSAPVSRSKSRHGSGVEPTCTEEKKMKKRKSHRPSDSDGYVSMAATAGSGDEASARRSETDLALLKQPSSWNSGIYMATTSRTATPEKDQARQHKVSRLSERTAEGRSPTLAERMAELQAIKQALAEAALQAQQQSLQFALQGTKEEAKATSRYMRLALEEEHHKVSLLTAQDRVAREEAAFAEAGRRRLDEQRRREESNQQAESRAASEVERLAKEVLGVQHDLSTLQERLLSSEAEQRQALEEQWQNEEEKLRSVLLQQSGADEQLARLKACSGDDEEMLQYREHLAAVQAERESIVAAEMEEEMLAMEAHKARIAQARERRAQKGLKPTAAAAEESFESSITSPQEARYLESNPDNACKSRAAAEEDADATRGIDASLGIADAEGDSDFDTPVAVANSEAHRAQRDAALLAGSGRRWSKSKVQRTPSPRAAEMATSAGNTLAETENTVLDSDAPVEQLGEDASEHHVAAAASIHGSPPNKKEEEVPWTAKDAKPGPSSAPGNSPINVAIARAGSTPEQGHAVGVVATPSDALGESSLERSANTPEVSSASAAGKKDITNAHQNDSLLDSDDDEDDRHMAPRDAVVQPVAPKHYGVAISVPEKEEQQPKSDGSGEDNLHNLASGCAADANDTLRDGQEELDKRTAQQQRAPDSDIGSGIIVEPPHRDDDPSSDTLAQLQLEDGSLPSRESRVAQRATLPDPEPAPDVEVGFDREELEMVQEEIQRHVESLRALEANNAEMLQLHELEQQQRQEEYASEFNVASGQNARLERAISSEESALEHLRHELLSVESMTEASSEMACAAEEAAIEDAMRRAEAFRMEHSELLAARMQEQEHLTQWQHELQILQEEREEDFVQKLEKAQRRYAEQQEDLESRVQARARMTEVAHAEVHELEQATADLARLREGRPFNLLDVRIEDLHDEDVWEERAWRMVAPGVVCSKVSRGKCCRRTFSIVHGTLVVKGNYFSRTYSRHASELIGVYRGSVSSDFAVLKASSSTKRSVHADLCSVITFPDRSFSLIFSSPAEREEFVETLTWFAQRA